MLHSKAYYHRGEEVGIPLTETRRNAMLRDFQALQMRRRDCEEYLWIYRSSFEEF
jgi:hypothetical protein